MRQSKILEERVGRKSLISITEGEPSVKSKRIYEGGRRIVGEVELRSEKNITKPYVEKIQ